MYKLLAPLACKLGTQHARTLATIAMKLASAAGTAQPLPMLKRNVMGLEFPGPVGLAAGFDKHGKLYPCLARLGFGFAEIGTVTPTPEPGRSHGLAIVTANLARHPRPRAIPLGVSISMNRATPPQRMAQDYLACLTKVWHHVDYITLNLGVRAGPDLHLTENKSVLRTVFAAIKEEQARLAATHQVRRPITVKVDQARGDTAELLACVREFSFDGLILSGTGGKDNHRQALSALEWVAQELHGIMPVISVGGIRTPQDARDRLAAGAALVQLYTGLMKSGPYLVRQINRVML